MASEQKIFHADHCGSLIRPDKLREARKQFAKGNITAGQLGTAEDEAVLDVLQLQADAG